jgi:homocitrate synthase NifV
VLGKHSGSHGVMAAYAQLGLFVSRPEADALLSRIRGFVVRAKRAPQQQELADFYDELSRRGGALAA